MDEIRSTISPEMKMQMEMSVAIANRIYEILEAKGMSQKDLAHRLGKTETEVSWTNCDQEIWKSKERFYGACSVNLLKSLSYLNNYSYICRLK
jgi:transcriptional regulator with XRE-family HTH domain